MFSTALKATRLPALALAALAVVTGCGGTPAAQHPAASAPASSAGHAASRGRPTAPDPAFGPLEKRYGVRLGVYGIDTGSGRTVTWQPDRRFAYASTYKALACAVLLRQDSDAQLAATVTYRKADIVDHSPVTQHHIGTGMTVSALCDAAIRFSDNTAGNLVLRRLGGPAGLTAGLRRAGDGTTTAARFEPGLNDAVPGDRRDTSTPRALAGDLRYFAAGPGLPARRRAVLNGWMERNALGMDLIRAAVPSGWTAGDKSGAAAYGTRNDIAVIHPPGRAPLILAVLSSRTTPNAPYNDTLLAAAARIAVRDLS